jgi:hypothetical protein
MVAATIIQKLPCISEASFIVDSSTDPIIVDFWTYNRGNIVYAEYKGRFEA